MNNNTYCVIMAGGVGSRFWPLSRSHMPKQFLDILGTGKTLIRQTVDRFSKICPIEN
ncbi:MAG: mannose-1-phosphate guanylyltransferase, partial [Bacteroidetes bacterium]|nr:mannose-1-phosphate guanylyltransferase [Bacteroidota bacterium]